MCIRTCLSVAYGAYEAVMGEMNGLDGARGFVISEGHQGGVINHLREPRRRCVPLRDMRIKWPRCQKTGIKPYFYLMHGRIHLIFNISKHATLHE